LPVYSALADFDLGQTKSMQSQAERDPTSPESIQSKTQRRVTVISQQNNFENCPMYLKFESPCADSLDMESDWNDENFLYFRKFENKTGISQKPCSLTDLGFSYAQKN
jgi:hypothetical protein